MATPRGEYESLKKLHNSQLPTGIDRDSDEATAWYLNKFHTLHDRGMAFVAAHPDNPLRWDVVVLLRWGRNLVVTVLRDGTKTRGLPPAERTRWNQIYFTMLEDLLEAPDAGTSARHEALRQLIEHYCVEIRRDVIDNPRKGLIPALLEWVTELHALDPQSSMLPPLYTRVARMLNAIDPVRCRAFLDAKHALHRGSSHQDGFVRRNADNFRRLMRNQEGPANDLWRYLQKLDPRFADPSAFRDKVVLVVNLSVDWTSRTMDLEELHQRYHGAGLEIIQIATLSQDRSYPLLRRDKAAIARFAAEKKWSWPVIAEDSKYDEQFSTYWAQLAHPSILVVGRDGRIAREIPGDMAWDAVVQRQLWAPVGRR